MSRCTCTPLVECNTCIAARVAHHADLYRGGVPPSPRLPRYGPGTEQFAREEGRDERRKRRRDERLLGLTR